MGAAWSKEGQTQTLCCRDVIGGHDKQSHINHLNVFPHNTRPLLHYDVTKAVCVANTKCSTSVAKSSSLQMAYVVFEWYYRDTIT